MEDTARSGRAGVSVKLVLVWMYLCLCLKSVRYFITGGFAVILG
jgi:hypothetical protein